MARVRILCHGANARSLNLVSRKWRLRENVRQLLEVAAGITGDRERGDDLFFYFLEISTISSYTT